MSRSPTRSCKTDVVVDSQLWLYDLGEWEMDVLDSSNEQQ